MFENALSGLGDALPGVLGALVVLLIGYFIAKVLQGITYRMLSKTKLDDKLLGTTNTKIESEKILSKMVYYIVMVLVLLVVLEMLGVSQVLDPLKNMVNEFTTYLPNMIAAGVIGFVGYLLATIASGFVNLSGNIITRFSDRIGLQSNFDLVGLLKKVVFILIFIPVLIIALDTLNMTAISDPAKEMLGTMLNAIPKIIAAVLIITFFYIGGKYLTGIIRELLSGLGVDDLVEKMHLDKIIGTTKLSTLLANTAFFFIMFIGLVTGIEQLGFAEMVDTLNNLMAIAGQIFFGLVILAVGNFIAGIAHNAASANNNPFIASIVRFAILGLFLAMALSTMGIGDDIVKLAFGLTLGSIAVAVALSFGLGGREAAGKQMEYILKKFRNEE